MSAVLYAVGRFLVVPAVRRAVARSRVNQTLGEAVEKLTGMGVVVALAVGAAAGGFHAFLGGSALVVAAFSLSVGYASREVLSNFVAGIFLV
ncbi:hypothetical protein BRC81_16515 [Halobacteriales archaeon QS_1_68_20]|nr:MAG: hypothetical protein BRC81_16515 [Halobacteriales archaeon QS_1_68_20]